jgi:molecular chaperone DnaK
VKDAEAHAAEDKKRRELVETRNQAEALIHQVEKSLEENKDNAKVGAVKGEVEAAIASAKEAMGKDDAEAIRTAIAALTAASMKIGEAVYAGQGDGASSGAAEGGGDSTQASSGSRDDVVDADFEEINDDKKSA